MRLAWNIILIAIFLFNAVGFVIADYNEDLQNTVTYGFGMLLIAIVLMGSRD